MVHRNYSNIKVCVVSATGFYLYEGWLEGSVQSPLVSVSLHLPLMLELALQLTFTTLSLAGLQEG